MKHGVDVIRHLNAAEGRDLFAAVRSYLRETLQEEIQGKDSAPGSGSGKYRSWCIVFWYWFRYHYSVSDRSKVSGWTVLGRFYSHLAFCNYFWPVRYRVGIVGIRNLGYRRRDRELDTCPSRYHQKMLGIIPIRRYWYLGCDTESIPSRFLRNVRIVKKWAIPC